MLEGLRQRGWRFYTFIGAGGARFMCGWDTRPESVDALLADIQALTIPRQDQPAFDAGSAGFSVQNGMSSSMSSKPLAGCTGAGAGAGRAAGAGRCAMGGRVAGAAARGA